MKLVVMLTALVTLALSGCAAPSQLVTEADAPYWTAQPNPAGPTSRVGDRALTCVDLLTDDEHRSWEYGSTDLSTVGLSTDGTDLTIVYDFANVGDATLKANSLDTELTVRTDTTVYVLRQYLILDPDSGNGQVRVLVWDLSKGKKTETQIDNATYKLTWTNKVEQAANVTVTYPLSALPKLTAFGWLARAAQDECPAGGSLDATSTMLTGAF